MAVTSPQEFSTLITPAPNALSAFSSTSYTISWYMLTAEQVASLTKSSQRSVAGFQLLVQSGGAASSQKPVSTPLRNTAIRNQFFDLDFYVDDVVVKNIIAGAGTGSSHIAHELTFKITEPYGITLIERLKKAVDEIASAAGTPGLSHLSQPYLLVIRFYGYDAAGRLVKGVTSNVSDSSAAYEKFLPFMLKSIKFRINNNMVEYVVEGQPLWQASALGSMTGAIPSNIGISGATVKDLLAGETAGDTGVRSLASAVNKYYKDNTPAGQVPNQIEIQFAEGAGIAEAVVKKVGPVSKAKTTQPAAATAEEQLSPKKGSVAVAQRNHEFTAGTPIVWAINQIVQASSYITDQQDIDVTETGEVLPKPGSKGQAQWFNVTGNTELIYDPGSQGYVNKTTYTVVPYLMYLSAPNMPTTGFRGCHKRYDYWFTGTNKEVLNFEQEYNCLYFTQIPAQNLEAGATAVSGHAQENQARQIVLPGSGGSPQGATGGNTDPGAAAASRFYSLADLAESRMVIHGDPQWLGEFDMRESGSPYAAFTTAAGTVNYETQEVLYEITFNTPGDYDHNTGLMQVGMDGGTIKTPAASFIYRAVEVTSMFNDGKFTQELRGNLRPFFPTTTPSASTTSSAANNSTSRTSPYGPTAPSLGSGIPGASSDSGFMLNSNAMMSTPGTVAAELSGDTAAAAFKLPPVDVPFSDVLNSTQIRDNGSPLSSPPPLPFDAGVGKTADDIIQDFGAGRITYAEFREALSKL